MKLFEIIILLVLVGGHVFSFDVQAQDVPEIQIFFPDQQLDFRGLNIHPRKGLITVDNGVNVEEYALDLSDYFVNDSTQVNAFTLQSGASDGLPNIAFSLSQWDGQFAPGAVYSCSAPGSCAEFQTPFFKEGRIQSLGYADSQASYAVSFDQIYPRSTDIFNPKTTYLFFETRSGGGGIGSATYDDYSGLSNDQSTLNAFNVYDTITSAGNSYQQNNWNSINENANGLFLTSDVAFNDQAGVLENPLNDDFRQEFKVQAYAAANVGRIGSCQTTFEIIESDGVVSIPLKRLGGDEFNNSAFITAVNGSAIANVDYVPFFQFLDWPHLNDDDQLVIFTVLDNQDIDGDKTFTLNLSRDVAPDNYIESGFSLIDQNYASLDIIIRDNDGDLLFKDGFDPICSSQ